MDKNEKMIIPEILRRNICGIFPDLKNIVL